MLAQQLQSVFFSKGKYCDLEFLHQMKTSWPVSTVGYAIAYMLMWISCIQIRNVVAVSSLHYSIWLNVIKQMFKSSRPTLGYRTNAIFKQSSSLNSTQNYVKLRVTKQRIDWTPGSGSGAERQNRWTPLRDFHWDKRKHRLFILVWMGFMHSCTTSWN